MVRIITEKHVTTPHNTSPLYAEGVHMLDGLADEEVDDFLEDHPTIIPLFEIDALPTIGTPVAEEVTEETLPQDEPDPTTIAELRHARDAFERELAISQRVKASTLEALNLESDESPHTLHVEYQCIMVVFTLSSLLAQVRVICVNSLKGSCPK